MDTELVVWTSVFVGGYAAALVALLRIALRKRKGETELPETQKRRPR